MKICRFTDHNKAQPRYGVLHEGENILHPIVADSPFVSDLRVEKNTIPLAHARLLAPVAPSKIVCVGRNYKDHAAELGNPVPAEPLLFLKPPSAIIASGEQIELPLQSNQVEHEGELGVVIGREIRPSQPLHDSLAFVFGYTIVNDVTARDLQRADVQFTRAKSFDTFCPVGPFISTDIDPSNVEITTRVNALIKQQARTSAMIFSVSELVRYIASVMTLLPGDLIATGTPAGVSKINDGDTVEVEIEGLGLLRNTAVRRFA
jgi:2-keto-4-pentenoate hydratase/2-oxohepta-3-ene-1,7-dioic acid hydratase in catechol pathway